MRRASGWLSMRFLRPRASDAFTKLRLLHLDHEQDAVVTCDLWKRAMPSSPIAWDDGVEGGLLCHLLFSVTANATRGPAMLRFRCGPGASRCHNMPHYETLVDVALTKPDEPTIARTWSTDMHRVFFPRERADVGALP